MSFLSPKVDVPAAPPPPPPPPNPPVLASSGPRQAEAAARAAAAAAAGGLGFSDTIKTGPEGTGNANQKQSNKAMKALLGGDT